MINPEDIKAGLVLGHADAALLRDVIKRAEAAEAKLAELEKQKAVATLHKGSKGRVTVNLHTDLPLGFTDVFTRPAPAAILAELVPSKLEEKEGDYQSLRDEKRGYNACIAAILCNIEEQSK